MKLIVSGSRHFSLEQVSRALSLVQHITSQATELVHGDCKGTDKFAVDIITHCPPKPMPADWSLGKRGGPIRNARMAKYGEALIAIWDGVSDGTRDMILAARKERLPTIIIYLTPLDNDPEGLGYELKVVDDGWSLNKEENDEDCQANNSI
jgi:hypothetical protein